MANDDRIATDLVAARDAYDELGKALETGEFSPPEAHHWKYRAADAMKAFMGACGWDVGGADPRVQTLQAALRELLELHELRRPDIAKLVTEDGLDLDAYDQLLMALRRGLREALAGCATLARTRGCRLRSPTPKLIAPIELAELRTGALSR